MRFIAVFIFLFLISSSAACVIELRNAIFYVNGSQEVTRDWFIVDFENSYGYDFFDVHFNDIASLPVIPNGTKVRIDPYKTVSPRSFPIAVFATVENLMDRSIVHYLVQNYGDRIEVLISIPMFPNFISCDKCIVSNGNIVFNKTLERNESATFNLTLTRDFVIPDGVIGFSYAGTIEFSFAANVPVTVEKGRGENWIGVFKVSNILERKISGNVTAFVEFCENMYCSRTKLFYQEIELEPGEIFNRSVEVKSPLVPTFFFWVQLRAKDYCKLTILPCTELEGRYVIGYATLKGFAWISPSIPSKEIALPPEIITPPTPEITRTPEVSRRVERVEVLEVTFPPQRVAREVVTQYVATMLLPIFGMVFTTIFSLVKSRRGIVATKEHEIALRVLYPKFRIFTIPSAPLRGGIVIEPDESLVSRLLWMGLDRIHAELVAVAVKVKKPVIVDNVDAARIAASFGIPVILHGRS